MKKRKVYNESFDLDVIKTHDFKAIENERWKNGVFCPWCRSNKYWLNGSGKKSKLYKCASCRKTFDFLTNTFLSYSKLPLEQWDKFLDSYLASEPCKVISKKVGITIKNAWNDHLKLDRWLLKFEIADKGLR